MKSAIKYFGGKHYLADKITALFPPHKTYTEPYFGSGAVLFAKEFEGVNEIVNDIDQDLTLFWLALQNETAFQHMHRKAIFTPFSERSFEAADRFLKIKAPEWDSEFWQRRPESLGDRGYWFYVRCRTSLGGRGEKFALLTKSRTRRGMNEQAAALIGSIERLPEIHERLRRVAIYGGREARDVIQKFDGPDTLHYLDPPYPEETRVAGGYRHEMDRAAHVALLDLIRQVKGKVALSSYPNALYDQALKGWNRFDFDVANNASHSEIKDRETEALYCNF